MGRQSGYWDTTWNPVAGCRVKDEGCRGCLSMCLAGTQQAAHHIPLYRGLTRQTAKGKHVWTGEPGILEPAHSSWIFPLTWEGAEHPLMGPGSPSLMFVVVMGDLFMDARPIAHIEKVISTVAASRHIGLVQSRWPDLLSAYFAATPDESEARWQKRFWLGTSTANQKRFDEYWPHMRPLAEAGWTVYVVIAPMLELVTLPDDLLAFGNRVWVICSGEEHRGDEPRPMDAAWPRAVLAQCRGAGVPFFMNQMSGRKQIPADLFVRQFPARPGASWIK